MLTSPQNNSSTQPKALDRSNFSLHDAYEHHRKELLERRWVAESEPLRTQLQLLLDRGEGAEIEALARCQPIATGSSQDGQQPRHALDYVAHVYLPEKICQGEWLF